MELSSLFLTLCLHKNVLSLCLLFWSLTIDGIIFHANGQENSHSYFFVCLCVCLNIAHMYGLSLNHLILSLCYLVPCLGQSLWLEGFMSLIACQISICFEDYPLDDLTLVEETYWIAIIG